MIWLKQSLEWWFYLFLLGIVFYPLTKAIFKKFPLDYGYPFAKTLAIIFTSYSIYLLSLLKILPFTRLSLFLILGILGIVNLIIFKKIKNNRHNKYPKAKIFFLVVEEIIFFFSFLFLTFIRGQEPSIRGLEKFMDFGFINSILRSKYFPPLDMWLSADNINPKGYPINYYYFGHLTGAFLIKLTNFPSSVGYNLILSTIFAQGITLVFSIVINLVFLFEKKITSLRLIFYGLLGSFIVNLGGNLHTIYVLTSGYHNDQPIPFWQIFSHCNTLFPQFCQSLGKSLTTYWYPNATRFIPFTIHEFPSYSYVVADLHGHVFDIPFVLTTLVIIILIFLNLTPNSSPFTKFIKINLLEHLLKKKNIFLKNLYHYLSLVIYYSLKLRYFFFLGFLIAINYMTNAFDGPIYFLLSAIVIILIFGFSFKSLYSLLIIIFSFFIFTLPFSSHFRPFVSGIGVNCSPDFLTKIAKFKFFLFEKGNCQISPFWMLFVLWGFFWINFAIFLFLKVKVFNKKSISNIQQLILNIIFLLFSYGSFLVLIPEFFYIKDIYPAHFRANTMFKLGYQAFIMMGIASSMVFYLIKKSKKSLFIIIYSLLFIFIFIYPFFAFPSYYGKLDKTPQLDGSQWLKDFYPQDKEIIDYLNKNIKNQPVIIEAQGDSYTDYERISSYTGLPTVAGWWVHEWLWRGSADVVGKRIADVVLLYESKNIEETMKIIKKYKIKYIIVSQLERQKYPNLNEEKFRLIGEKIFQSSNNLGALYKVKLNNY